MTITDVTLTGLRVVEQAAVHGSFSAAAEALGYTQSAVSRQVAAVEAAVGAQLFERVARGVRPTEAGRVLVQHTREVLARLEVAESALERVRDRLAGRLVLGSIPAAMSVLVPRAIARLAQDHPGLEVTLHEAPTPDLVERVRDGLLDVAVIATGGELPHYDLAGLRRDVLLVDTLRLAVPVTHRLARRERVSVDDLRGESWIVGHAESGEPAFGAWPTLDDAAVAFVGRGWPARLGMVAAGLGLAVLPNISAASVPAGVAVVEVDDPNQLRRSAVTITPEDPEPTARAMVGALRSEAVTIAFARDT